MFNYVVHAQMLLQETALESEAYSNFVNSLDSEESKKHYRYIFPYFMRFCKVENYDDMLKIEPKRLEGLIRDYIIHLKENKRSSATIANYVASVAHFYEMNDVLLNWKKLKKFKGKYRIMIEDKPYSRDQIKILLDYAQLRDKCIVLLMSSAGLRRGALPMLKIQDLTPIDSYQLYKIRVYAREEEEYYTYCTPETRRCLDQYMEWRTRQGETLKPTSPLLRREFNSLQVHRPRPLNPHGITSIIHRLLERSGVRPQTPAKRGSRTELMQCHGFRKYFETTTKLAGVDMLYLKRLMGHSTGLENSYFKPTDAQILEGNDKIAGYIAAIADLTINPTEEENQKLKQELERTKTHHTKEWELLRQQVTEIKRKMGFTW